MDRSMCWVRFVQREDKRSEKQANSVSYSHDWVTEERDPNRTNKPEKSIKSIHLCLVIEPDPPVPETR